MTTTKHVSKRDEMRARRAAAQQRQRILMIAIVVLAVIGVAAIILVPMLKPPFQATVNRTNVHGTSVGDPNAPVKVEEFSDFQCPYCEQWHTKDEATFYNTYVATGKVYFTYVPFSFLGNESVRAAEAAYCADEQGKFWEYHDILFANQGSENSGAFSDQNLQTFAQELKLNTSQFNSCLSSDKYVQKVTDDVNLGKSKGVNATPYFIVNNGAPIDMNSLNGAVDAALAAKK